MKILLAPMEGVIDHHLRAILTQIGGYDLSSGVDLWKLVGGGDIPVPTSIVSHDLIFITNSHGRFQPIYAIHADAEGELTQLFEGSGQLFFPESKMALANYLARRGRLDEAESLLLEVISANPDNPAAPTLLASVRKRRRG